jgi:hypothetical protein
MNDLIKLVFAQIPKYLLNFFALVSGPKSFVRERNIYSDQSLTEAITFLAISFVLTLILKAPFMPEDVNLWQFIATRGLSTLIEMGLLAAALRFAWTLTGSKTPFGRFFITFCYYYAIGLIILEIFTILAYGLVKIWDPEFYTILVGAYKNKRFNDPKADAYMMQAVDSGDSGKLLVFAGFNLIILGGWAALLTWIIAGWGAYRELTSLPKKKSILAGIIFFLLSPVVFLVTYFLYYTLP